MKKVVLIASLGLMAIGFNACKKDVAPVLVQSTDYEGVTTDGKMLIFESVEDYEKVISFDEEKSEVDDVFYNDFIKYAKNLNFSHLDISSLMHKKSSEEDFEDVSNPFINAILNSDGVVQIGNHLYRLDFDEEKVYVLPVNLKNSHYDLLVSGSDKGNDISVYSFDEDVIYLVNENEEFGEKLFCREGYATMGRSKKRARESGWEFLANFDWINNNAGLEANYNAYRIKAVVRYQTLGIHFSLRTYCAAFVHTQEHHVDVEDYTAWENWDDENGPSATSAFGWRRATELEMRINWTRRYKRRCQGEDTGWWTGNNYGNGRAKGQSWRGPRALTRYELGANFFVKVNGKWEPIKLTPNNIQKTRDGREWQIARRSGY